MSNSPAIVSPTAWFTPSSTKGMAQPPWVNLLLGSSSGPPGACMTPSRVTCVIAMIFLMVSSSCEGPAPVDIAVILDVVFNHTNEGNHQGPTFNSKGFGNEIYYHLVEQDRQYYMDYSGCGNTVNCNHPIVEKFIVECLEFWVRQMHVDGVRFDEGSILAREQDGVPMAYPPVVWSIELSGSLLDTRIIAEAWDAAGLFQIGYFPGYRWAEWKGRFRDDTRRFVKGEPGTVSAVCCPPGRQRRHLPASGHLLINRVNFVTCHDGFTLNDLVSYNGKHNEANGEDNRDGIKDNLSWNCGWEGATDDPAIQGLRERQIKNFAAILRLGLGNDASKW